MPIDLIGISEDIKNA